MGLSLARTVLSSKPAAVVVDRWNRVQTDGRTFGTDGMRPYANVPSKVDPSQLNLRNQKLKSGKRKTN